MDYTENDLVPACRKCGDPLNDEQHNVDHYEVFAEDFTVVICQNKPTLFTK